MFDPVIGDGLVVLKLINTTVCTVLNKALPLVWRMIINISKASSGGTPHE